MHRTVVLEHTLTDGSRHFDWMIEDPSIRGERRLATWRTDVRPDRADRAFTGLRIGAHRTAYLAFEGEVSGGRGWVRRLAAGRVEWEAATEAAVRIRVVWDSGRIARYAGKMGGEGGWLFELAED
ncbi:MAG: hypothetical protein LAT64_03015 [Phycisphaerales bacterium]|nr:hypothetical protein [Planctomycetota bacterium]MCH8507727.1 hypothetical protein [Phycisphaerales bacterium]